MSSFKSQSILLANRNVDTVQPQSPLAKAFDIKNGIGTDLEVSGIILKYKSGLQRVQLDLKTRKTGNPSNLAPTGEGISLCAVGTPMDSDFMQVFKAQPFLLRNNTAIDVHLATPGGETINPRDVDVTLVCDPAPANLSLSTALIPFRNSKNINSGESQRFELKNPISRELDIVGILAKYENVLGQVQISFETKNGGANFDLVPSGMSVPLCAIGSPFGAKLLQMFRIKPVRLTASGIVAIRIENPTILGVTAFTEQVDLTFVCEYPRS